MFRDDGEFKEGLAVEEAARKVSAEKQGPLIATTTATHNISFRYSTQFTTLIL